MHHRHLGETEDHRHRRDGGNGIAEIYGRAGVADRDAAAHEQAGADRATQADHHELRAAQIFVEAGLAAGNRGCIQGSFLGDGDRFEIDEL